MSNMSDKVAEISDPTHHTSLMTSLRQFINTESFVDVQFICQGGHKVFAHKLMLISVSRLLKKLLTENPDSNEMITIHLPDVNSKLLRIVVNFLYIGFMRLNNTEMDQFKLVLGLLDIELFQKSPDQDNTQDPSSDPLSIPSHSNNDGYYVQSSASVPQNVVNTVSAPMASRFCPSQVVPMGCVPVGQTSASVNNLPVDSRSQQYVTVHTDQLGIPNNRGEVMISYSTVPVQHGANSVVVQHSPLVLPAGNQNMLTNQNQYNTFTRNVINSPVAASHIGSNVVPVNSIGQLPSQQVNLQQVSPIALQPSAQQQIVRFVPATQSQTVVNSNISFTNAPSEPSHPITSTSQINNAAQFTSQQLTSPLQIQGQTPPKARNANSSQNQVISNNIVQISSSSSGVANTVAPRVRLRNKGTKRKSSQLIKPVVVSQDIINLSDDDEESDTKKPLTPSQTMRQLLKTKKPVFDSGGSVSSNLVPSSQSVSSPSPTSRTNNKQNSSKKKMFELNVEGRN